MKARSTTTGVEVGFSREMESGSELAVVPPGKYQAEAVVLWHGASDHPDVPWTAWVAATPPPERMTVSDSHDPDGKDGMDGVTTARAGTSTAVCTEAPASLTAVMAAATGRAVVLVRIRKPGAMPEPVDWPVQYQAEDSALGALTSAPGTAGAAAGAEVPPRAGGDGHARDDQHDHGEHHPPALAAVVGRAHDGPSRAAGRPPRPRRRGRPRIATATATQAASSSMTVRGT